MIPKVIHYCWFSGDKKGRFIRNCIKSWQKVMPDYTIKCWDSDSFDFDSVPFVRQAYREKKWAFVADYIRLYALYTEGGIYLDSDVKVFRSFDPFLNNQFFIGTEPLPENHFELESAIMGSVAGHPYVKDCLEYYKKINFRKADGSIIATCPMIMSRILDQYGYKRVDQEQQLSGGIHIYSRKSFGHLFGTKPGNLYAIHYFNGSWLDTKRGLFYRFCKRNDYMKFYLWIENFVSYLK